jgi:hypothetical protein
MTSAIVKSAAKSAADWPVDDITGLAGHVPEVDPRHYFDAQARESYEQSLLKWPLLARLMSLIPREGADTSAVQNSSQGLTVE